MRSKICRARIDFSMNMLRPLFSVWFKSKEEKAALIEKFEKAFAEYIGVDYAISTSSAKFALYLSLKALGVEKDDEIIVPAFTVREVIDVIIVLGLIPVFVDINLRDANMDPGLIDKKISKKTRFILMTHIYGCPCDVEAVLKISKKYNLTVIEDAAQACGAEYKLKKAGSFGKVAYFSFGILKNLNTLGGGMIVTKEKPIARAIEEEREKFPDICSFVILKRAFIAMAISFFTYPLFFSWLVYPLLFLYKKIKRSGAVEFFKVDKINIQKLRKHNRRFSAVQAAIGLLRLGEIDKINNGKIHNARILNEELKDCAKALLFEENSAKKNIYLNYVIRAKDRKKLVDDLFAAGIDVSPGQVTCCADLEDFSQFYSDCPMSRKMQQENVYLPVYSPLDKEHMYQIANAVGKNGEKNKYDVFHRLIMEKGFYVPIFLSLLAFFIRFGFLAFSDNFKGPQPMLNIITSLHIFNFPSIMENIFYQQLPVFLYSLFCVIKIAGEQIISGRLLCVFWGSMSVIPFYYLSNRLFTKRIALLASILFCFYPEHIVNSVITMPDAAGLFFLLCSLYYLEDEKNVLSAISLGFGTACAYICWFFVPIIFVYILLTAKEKIKLKSRNAFSFLFITALFPLLWIMLINNKYGMFNLFYKNFFEARSLWQYCFVYTQTVSIAANRLFAPMPLLFLLGLAGLYQSAKARKYYRLFFLIGALVLAVSSGLFRKEIPVLEEGIFILSILLLPFAVLGIDFILGVLKLKSTRNSGLAVGLICLSLLFISVSKSPYPACFETPGIKAGDESKTAGLRSEIPAFSPGELHLPAGVKNLCSWLKENKKGENAKFYISKRNNPFYSSIIMLSGLPQGNFYYYDKEDELANLEIEQRRKTYFIYRGALNENVLVKFKMVKNFDKFLILMRLDN
ncbi:MAG: DegT/DnrJ/EryC1/StrS family aminotransferase [Candidatus Omnitrophica bacterium]|nr:DegT/DnrJ/EryC1/StrS family aminotransferase [Candidatus Omnitrophota bacterium]